MNEQKEFNRRILATLIEYANKLVAAGRVTEKRSRTTYRIYEDDGSQRIFLRQANIMMMKKISGFSIKNRHEKAKFGKFSSRNVVHVFPLPPPFRAIPNVK